ncbi:hypothetical protein K435DRAFT_824947 [Dendrothele bispora CBS 962.96]|uniref:Rrn7/TAF1B C-terminal cyclin domain-containing protein n=1 Tax=Dendrothele bispora (strain CBS 962.96) TaxID=1314807 RepID=A0A4S8MYD8_DENBC|nr:hypothetical protein K435DRAFT_824947 [Dendrothele bispora CBS 962.96]
MAPKRRCPVCGSKQWHKEPSSGLIACSEGHILQNYRNEATEAEDMGQHALRKRTLKSGRKTKEIRSNANPELYHGAQGRYLYFQCQQFILRKQIAAVTRLWKLPPEFEMVCRDIWTLHLSMLSDPVPENPSMELESEEKKDEEQSTSPRSTSGLNARRKLSPSSPSGSPSPSGDSEDDERKENDDEEDPLLADLMRQNSETSSQEESGDEQPIAGPAKIARTRGYSRHEGPAMNLAVLMVALWTMKIPVLYRDFAKHIEMWELPYLEPVRLLPQEMVLHLTKHNIQALSPTRTPDTIHLHKLTSRLAKLMYRMYSVSTPEANAAPILWRVIQGLGGTPLLYRLTKRLSHLLSLPLALHHTLVPGLRQIKQKDPEHHKYDNAPVEASFLAATVVMLKLVYGLDGKARLPADAADPACALPKIADYLETIKQLQETDTKDSVFNSESWTSVDKLDDATMDAYMSFCEQVLVGSDAEEHKILTEYFPVTKSTHVGHDETTTKEYQYWTGRHANGVTDDDMDRPGAGYKIYASRDVLGSPPEELERVVARACEWGRIRREYIYGLVEKYERRLVRRLKG